VTATPPLSEQFPHIRTPWKAIAAELRYAVTHDMVPGEPAGSMDTLAALYGVNRKTAGKALRAAAAEGLIELLPGRGYVVL
jgi:DNA-binding GntR family transcriptional regulator